MNITRLFTAIALLLIYTEANADCPSFFDVSKADPDVYPSVKFGGGPTNGLAEAARSLFAISAGTDKSNATATYALSASEADGLISRAGPTMPVQGCSHALSFTLSSPIDKSDKVTDLASLDGLANAFSLETKYVRYIDTISLTSDKLRSLQGRLAAKSKVEDIDLNRANLIKHFGSEHRIIDEFESAGSVKSWFIGGSAKLGREKFKYIDSGSFTEVSENEKPWSASFFIGKEFGSWIITGRLKAEQSYKAQGDITRCQPILNSTDLNCLTGPSAAPRKVDSRQVSVEFRRMIAGRFGISPTINHDFEEDVTGIEVPLFLWQDKKKQLTGGVRAGWRSDTDDTEFGLFVAQPF